MVETCLPGSIVMNSLKLDAVRRTFLWDCGSQRSPRVPSTAGRLSIILMSSQYSQRASCDVTHLPQPPDRDAIPSQVSCSQSANCCWPYRVDLHAATTSLQGGCTLHPRDNSCCCLVVQEMPRAEHQDCICLPFHLTF